MRFFKIYRFTILLFFCSRLCIAQHVDFHSLENYPELKYNNINSNEDSILNYENIKVLYFRYDEVLRGKKNPDFKRFHNAVNLQYLEVAKCFLDSFPEEVLQFKNLVVLDISENEEVRRIPENISNLTKLSELNLKNCNPLLDLNSLEHLSSLRTLRLSGLKAIPDGLENLNQLTELEIDNSALLDWNSFVQTVAALPNLRKLIIRNNNFSTLPLGIENLQLEELDISENSTLDWKNTFARLNSISGLKKLSLESCFKNDELTQEINQLKHIESLNLSDNRLGDKWTQVLSGLHLKELILSDCSMVELSTQISLLSDLEKLDISDNPICTLPAHISSLIHLKSLDASCYKGCYFFTSCKKSILNKTSIKLLSKTSLTELRLEGRETGTLPDNLGLLNHLELLDISYGNFDVLPSAVAKLLSLHTLILRGSCYYELIPYTKTGGETMTMYHEFKVQQSQETIIKLKALSVLDMRGSFLENPEKSLQLIQKGLPLCKIIL